MNSDAAADYFLTRKLNFNFTENSDVNKTIDNSDVLLLVSTEEAVELEITSTSSHDHHSTVPPTVPSTAVHTSSSLFSSSAQTPTTISSKIPIPTQYLMSTRDTDVSQSSIAPKETEASQLPDTSFTDLETELPSLTSHPTTANIMSGSTSMNINTSFVTESVETVTPAPAPASYSNDTPTHVYKHEPEHVKMKEVHFRFYLLFRVICYRDIFPGSALMAPMHS